MILNIFCNFHSVYNNRSLAKGTRLSSSHLCDNFYVYSRARVSMCQQISERELAVSTWLFGNVPDAQTQSRAGET